MPASRTGGAIGRRVVPTASAAPGVWQLGELESGCRENIWPTTDSFFANTMLLLRMDGANGSTTFTDQSSSLRAVTALGNAQISTAQSQYGGASLLLDGNGDYLSIAHSTDLNLTSGNFTIEMWVRWSGSNANGNLINKDGLSGTSYPQYAIRMNGSGRLSVELGSGNGVSSIQTLTANTSLPTNTWTHVALVRNSTTITLYQGGVSVASATQTATMTDGGRALFIGYSGGQATSFYWNGYIDDFRLTKAARYNASYTPAVLP